MIAIKDYTQFDERKLNALHTKSIDKLRELERKKSNIEKQIEQELLNKRQIAKAISANNDFVRLEDTQEYKEFQALDPETKERLRQEVEADIHRGN